MKKINIKAISLIALNMILFLTSCNVAMIPLKKNNNDETSKNWNSGISVWVVYWDLDNAAKKIMDMKDVITGISCFAAYFDEENNLFIPDNLKVFKSKLISEPESEQYNYYLTIVNDKKLGDKSSLKDTELLKTLFDSEESMRSHIKQIVNLANNGDYNGIEIDYEAIRSDMDLWQKYIVFCNLLYEEAKISNLELRIILEPNAPLDKLSFPEGPEYVMMCYNLYGTDTSKGPKANDKFLRNMLKKMDTLPGNKSFALATGGFHWIGKGKGVSITEEAAYELSKSKNANVYRSENSGALTFQYYDENGVENTVWYADVETLLRWQNIILSNGSYDIMLWRIE